MSLVRRAVTTLRSEVARNFLTYGIGAAFLSGISFFLVPIYTRVIAPEDYGLLELLNTGVAILGVVLPLGLSQSFFLEFYHHDNEGRRRLTLNISALYLLFAVPIVLILILLNGQISRTVFQSRASTFVIVAALLTSFLTFYRSVFFTALRLARKALPLALFQVASGLAVAGLNIHFVYYQRAGIPAIIGANLVAVIAAFVVAVIFYLAKGGRLHFDLTWGKAKGYFLLGLPLMPASAAVWALNASDRWVLTMFDFQKELGLYALAYKFGALYSMVIMEPFTYAYVSKVFAAYREDLDAAEQQNTRVLKLYLAVSIPLVTLAFLIGKPAFRVLVGPHYYGAYGYILPIVLGYVMAGATSVALCLPFYAKRSGWTAAVQGAGAVFNVGMNLILVRWYGAWAAALMTLGAFLLTFALALWLRARTWSAALAADQGS